MKESIKTRTEVEKYIECRRKRSIAVFRNGVYDGSLISILVEDKTRTLEKEVDDSGHYTGKIRNIPLVDIFADIRKKLDTGKVIKGGLKEQNDS